MFSQQPTYSSLFRDFHEIDPHDYQRVIRFYESREGEIRQLDFEEYFALTVAYVDALFETGAYRKHALLVDSVIETTIIHNVSFRRGEDLYYRMLLRKAASAYRIQQFDKAEHVLRELLRIRPDDQAVFYFLIRVFRLRRHVLLQRGRALAIFFILLAAVLTMAEVLLVRPFYSHYGALLASFRNLVLLAGVVSIVGAEALAYWSAYRRAATIRRSCRRQKLG